MGYHIQPRSYFQTYSFLTHYSSTSKKKKLPFDILDKLKLTRSGIDLDIDLEHLYKVLLDRKRAFDTKIQSLNCLILEPVLKEEKNQRSSKICVNRHKNIMKKNIQVMVNYCVFYDNYLFELINLLKKLAPDVISKWQSFCIEYIQHHHKNRSWGKEEERYYTDYENVLQDWSGWENSRVCDRNLDIIGNGGLTQEVYDSYCTNETKLRYIEFIYSLLTNRNYMDYIPEGKAHYNIEKIEDELDLYG